MSKNKKNRTKKSARKSGSERETQTVQTARQPLSPRECLKDKRVIGGMILFVLVTIMFAFSVNMRSEYKDYVATDHHHHLTATSVFFANNWLKDGIVHDHFAMMANPDSVEFETLKDRSFYDSYPSGCIIPLYLLAKVSGKQEIGFGFVQRWNLFNQYAVTLFLAFTVYALFMRLRLRWYTALGASVIPAVINLFMPAPFYFFHSVYFSDMAVLLPFAITVFLEVILPCRKSKKLALALDIFEGVVIFAGAFTDYLFLCVIAVVYIKRLLLGEIPIKPIKEWFVKSLKFAAPAILALGLFALQLAIDGPVRIIEMFKFRTGMSDTTGWTEAFADTFWKKYIIDGYGEHADVILKVSLLVVVAAIAAAIVAKLAKKRSDKDITCILSAAATIIIPCFMQVYLLKNHSAIHDFSSLKFSLVYATVPFVLIPMGAVTLARIIADKRGVKANFQNIGCVVTAAFLIACGINTHDVHGENAETFFPEPVDEYETVGNFIKDNTGYNDVVFSDEYIIYDSNDQPQRLAFSMKRVYKVNDIDAIYDKLKDLSGDYTVNIFRYTGDETGKLKELTDNADAVEESGSMRLYKISKDKFLRLAEE